MHVKPRRFGERLLGLATGVALALGVLVGASTPAFAATETEPNDSTATATPITLGVTVDGVSRSSGSSDNDYYRLQLPAAGEVRISLTFPSGLGTSAAYGVALLDSMGSVQSLSVTVAAGNWDGTWLSSQAVYLPAGTHYLRIRATSSSAAWGKPYRLTVNHTPMAAERESNDTTATATPISLGTTYRGSGLGLNGRDYDYYRLDVSTAGKFKLNFTFPFGKGTSYAHHVSVWDSSDACLYYFNLSAADADGSWISGQSMFLRSGTYYLRVLLTDSSPLWGQTYSLTASLQPVAAELEPNDTDVNATPLRLGETLLGSALKGSASIDRDYYALSLPSSSTVALTLRFPDGLGTGDAFGVRIYDAQGTSLYDFTVSTAQADGANLAKQPLTLPAGVVYVRITGTSSSPVWGKEYALRVDRPIPATGLFGEHTGDKYADVYATDSAGNLSMFPGSPTTLGTPTRFGTTMAGISYLVQIGDWTGDRRSDVLARRSSDNSLWIYSSTESGGLVPYKQVGWNWGGMQAIVYAGNLGGGSTNYIVGQQADGLLFRYQITTGGLSGKTQVGNGWNAMRFFFSVGDFDGDGRADIIGVRKDNGTMWVYRGTTSATLAPGRQIGNGWGPFTHAFSPGDLNGDGKRDMVGVDNTGTVYGFHNRGNGWWAPKQRMATGFGAYKLFC